jgi:hypothetical protein
MGSEKQKPAERVVFLLSTYSNVARCPTVGQKRTGYIQIGDYCQGRPESWENTRGTKPAGDNSGKNSPKLNETKRSSICDRRADEGACRLERYDKELSRITKAEWATPEQRSRAALKALGK